MASFGDLPPEVVQKCVEFLCFDEVIAEVKGVSKGVRAAARRALTRGRWRSIKYVAEEGLRVCAPDIYQIPPPAATSATFREAWALDAGLVMRVIHEWDYDGYRAVHGDLHPWGWRHGYYQARFLRIVEPSEEGLPRIAAACEDIYTQTRIPFGPGHLFIQWASQGGGVGGVAAFTSSREMSLGAGLESWADMGDVARFVNDVKSDDMFHLGVHIDLVNLVAVAHNWSETWVNRTKKYAFFAEAWQLQTEAFARLAEAEEDQDDWDNASDLRAEEGDAFDEDDIHDY